MQISLEQLNNIFSTAFNSKIVLNENTQRKDIELWDSYNHLNLIVELGDQLSISFTINEIERIDSIATLLEIIKEK